MIKPEQVAYVFGGSDFAGVASAYGKRSAMPEKTRLVVRGLQACRRRPIKPAHLENDEWAVLWHPHRPFVDPLASCPR